MSQLQIVCQNCGAKYRLPESFSGDRAKCKACGSVIDVAAQRDGASAAPAAARPAGAKPAAARPAAARPAAGARPASARSRAKSDDDAPRAASARRAGGRAGARSGGSTRARSRRGEEEEKKGSNQMALFGGIGAVVVVVLVAVFALGGDDDTDGGNDGSGSSANEVASNEKPDTGDEADNTGSSDPSTAASGDNGEEQGGTGGDGSASTGGAEETPKPSTKPAEKPTERPSSSGDVTEATLLDPRKDTEAVEWPAAVDAAARKEAEGWVEDLEYGGFDGIKAKRKLRENAYVGILAAINKMRTLDLRDGDQTRYAAELSRMLQDDLTGGTNVPFTDVAPGEAVPLEIAHKNGKCVKAWVDWATKATQEGNFLSSKDAFDRWIEAKAKEKAKQAK